MNTYHESVLKNVVVSYLAPAPGKSFIDATAGGAGHTRELLKQGSRVLAIDQDPEAVDYIRSQNLENLTVVKGNFSHIYKLAHENGFGQVDGILLDLGVSTAQLKKGERGFSFKLNGPLDMRMDPSSPISAQDIVNNFEKRRLNELFTKYGQEKFSLAISDAILLARQIKPYETTEELAKTVHEVYRKKGFKGKVDPATKIFQALRIVVNSELLNLEEALPQTTRLLKGHGRVVVISFHSLEDATVKRFFKQNEELEVLTKSPVSPTDIEVRENPSARSAKLRAAEKINAAQRL